SYQLLIKNILKMPLAQATKKQIVYRGEERFSYPQFAERISRLANVLSTLGAKRGTRVGVMDWDSHRYLESYFAVPMMGATLMMVNIRLSPEQIAYTINHAEVEILLVNKDFLPVLEQIRDKLPKLHKVVLLTDDGVKIAGPFAGEYEELLAAASDNFAFPDFDENTIATTFYTTGTTGNPKGVYFTHRQLVLHTLMLMSTMMMAGLNGRISREDVYMPLTPMFHVHAWGFPYVATMMGMQQVYAGRFLPPVVLKLLATERVTVSHCVPTIMHMILTAPEAANIDLRGWRVIIGGSAMPRAMCKAGLERGIDIFTGYGMSETCPILTLSHLKADLVDDVGSGSETEIDYRVAAGLPGALVELAIMDDDMNPQPRDGHSVGEVVARGPALTAGYVKNQEASDTLWKGGWLHTGDIGTIDENGYLHVLDRSKDVIKTGGEWISSIGLEDVILSHPAISECAVVGIEDSRWGERPIAVVVLKPDAVASEEDIKNLVRARTETGELSKFAIPDHVVFAQSLEKTSVGKLDKKKMRAMYGAVKAA
ncbi:MAG TPA: fatty acid--CoA ligase, partial [Acidocella sp.]|nr:fatty acid--CoA ligase [Acidocella sp.]